MNGSTWTGITIIAISLSTWAWRSHWSNTRTWSPIDDVPISLAQGTHYSSPKFLVNYNARYEIQIEVDNNGKVPFKELRCKLGLPNPHDSCGSVSGLRVRWAMTDSTKIRQGTSDETFGWGGAIPDAPKANRSIAYVEAKKGRRYKLDLDVLSDTAALNVTNPRVYVGESGGTLESYLFVTGFLRLGCIVIAIIGALIAVWGIYESQRQRAMMHLAVRVPSKE